MCAVWLLQGLLYLRHLGTRRNELRENMEGVGCAVPVETEGACQMVQSYRSYHIQFGENVCSHAFQPDLFQSPMLSLVVTLDVCARPSTARVSGSKSSQPTTPGRLSLGILQVIVCKKP